MPSVVCIGNPAHVRPPVPLVNLGDNNVVWMSSVRNIGSLAHVQPAATRAREIRPEEVLDSGGGAVTNSVLNVGKIVFHALTGLNPIRGVVNFIPNIRNALVPQERHAGRDVTEVATVGHFHRFVVAQHCVPQICIASSCSNLMRRCDMNMPGFTAEMAITKPSLRYRMAGGLGFFDGTGRVIPQMMKYGAFISCTRRGSPIEFCIMCVYSYDTDDPQGTFEMDCS